MTVIVYGDFNCLYSYLASQRVDTLAREGAARDGAARDGAARIEWRAVEHDPRLPLTGTTAAAQPDRDAELAASAALALPGEQAPGAFPALVSNTGAAVAAYAEAVADGVQDELRRRLFAAIWVRGRHLSHASDVQHIVSGLMWAAGPALPRLASPELPGLLGHDPDPARIVRRSGATIAQDGGPLTTAAHHRIQAWRRAWLALPEPVTPAVTGEDGTFAAGPGALSYLAGLLAVASAR